MARVKLIWIFALVLLALPSAFALINGTRINFTFDKPTTTFNESFIYGFPTFTTVNHDFRDNGGGNGAGVKNMSFNLDVIVANITFGYGETSLIGVNPTYRVGIGIGSNKTILDSSNYFGNGFYGVDIWSDYFKISDKRSFQVKSCTGLATIKATTMNFVLRKNQSMELRRTGGGACNYKLATPLSRGDDFLMLYSRIADSRIDNITVIGNATQATATVADTQKNKYVSKAMRLQRNITSFIPTYRIQNASKYKIELNVSCNGGTNYASYLKSGSSVSCSVRGDNLMYKVTFVNKTGTVNTIPNMTELNITFTTNKAPALNVLWPSNQTKSYYNQSMNLNFTYNVTSMTGEQMNVSIRLNNILINSSRNVITGTRLLNYPITADLWNVKFNITVLHNGPLWNKNVSKNYLLFGIDVAPYNTSLTQRNTTQPSNNGSITFLAKYNYTLTNIPAQQANCNLTSTERGTLAMTYSSALKGFWRKINLSYGTERITINCSSWNSTRRSNTTIYSISNPIKPALRIISPVNRSKIYFNQTMNINFSYQLTDSITDTMNTTIIFNSSTINYTRLDTSGRKYYNWTTNRDFWYKRWNITTRDTASNKNVTKNFLISVDVSPYNTSLTQRNISQVRDNESFRMMSRYNYTLTDAPATQASCNFTSKKWQYTALYNPTLKYFNYTIPRMQYRNNFIINTTCAIKNGTKRFVSHFYNISDATPPYDVAFKNPVANSTYRNGRTFFFKMNATDNSTFRTLNLSITNSSKTRIVQFHFNNMTTNLIGLQPNTTHYIKITAWDNSTYQKSNVSPTWQIMEDSAKPTVCNVRTPPGTISSIDAIIIFNITDNFGYINKTTIKYGPYLNVGNLTSTRTSTALANTLSFTLSSLLSNQVYFYNITVCDRANNCKTNGSFSFKTAEASSPSTPPCVGPLCPGGGGGEQPPVVPELIDCINDDGLCPSTCSSVTDNDCVAVPICGNGIAEEGETIFNCAKDAKFDLAKLPEYLKNVVFLKYLFFAVIISAVLLGIRQQTKKKRKKRQEGEE